MPVLSADQAIPPAGARLADSRQLSFFLVLACFALGQAVNLANGSFHPAAMGWLTAALVASLLAVAAPVRPWGERWAARLTWLVTFAGVAWQLHQLRQRPPGIYLRLSSEADANLFFAGLGLAAVAMVLGLGKRPWLSWVQFALLLGAFIGLGAWVLHFSPQPRIDVFYFQRDGVAELVAGRNPYAMHPTDIYGHSPFYGEGVSVDGKLKYGFPYMPLSLLWVLPAHLGLGDYRWAHLFAMAATAVFIATAVPSRLSVALAGLTLFTPRSFFVLEQGWTDPLPLMLLAATVWTAVRFPRALPIVLGLCLASKQTMLVALPAVWLLLPRPSPWRERVRFIALAAAVGLAVTLPFVLWNPRAFWDDVVVWQFIQPFRRDALSYLAWFARTGTRLPTALAFVGAGLGLALGMGRRAPTPAGFAATVALAFLLFFAFNKQAFCNYYYLTLGLMALAAAVSSPRSNEPQQAPLPTPPA